MPSVFSVFFKETTFSDKKYIIIISILYAILCPGLIGIAVWFKEPALVCKSIKAPDEAPFSCTQEIACQADLYTYQIDYSRSSPSIATEMEIVCSKKNLKRGFLSAYFFGGVLGCLANIFVYIPAKGRKYAQSILGFTHAFANFGIMFSVGNVPLLAFFFALLSFTWIIAHSYSFMSLNEVFSGDLAKSSTVLMMLTWGVFGIFYSILAFIFDSYYHILFFINGCVAGVDSFFLLTHSQTRPLKVLSKTPKNVLGYLKELWNYKQIRYNVLTYVIIWSVFCVTYNDVFIKLETVGGSLYFNIGIISLFEMSASFVGGIISMKFNIFKSIKTFMVFEVFLGLTFLLAPIQVQKNLPLSQAVALLIIMIMTKFFSDVINNLINLYAPKIFTDDFIGIFLIMSRLSSRIFLVILPSANFFFELIPLHPFLLLSILWGLCRIMTQFTCEIQEEGFVDVLNEFKVDIATRVSVMQNAEHLQVDDVLSNVVVGDNQNLGTIRASRISLRKSQASGINLEKKMSGGQTEMKDYLLNKDNNRF